MLESPSDLPDDVAVLQAMIALRDAEIDLGKQKLTLFETGIRERDYQIEKLKHELAGLRRHRFGSKSEALDQLELTLEEAEIAKAVDTPAADETNDTAEEAPKKKPHRKPLPDHLHRNNQVLSPGEECSDCGGSLKTLGEDVTEELEYVPGRFVVNRIIRPRMACVCCDARLARIAHVWCICRERVMPAKLPPFLAWRTQVETCKIVKPILH